MAEESIPVPPAPVGELKEKKNRKGLFGFLKKGKAKPSKKEQGQENTSHPDISQEPETPTAQDYAEDVPVNVPVDVSNDNSVESSKPEASQEKEEQKEEEEMNEAPMELEEELEPPKQDGPAEDINIDDLQKLEKDLEIDDDELKKESGVQQKSEKAKKRPGARKASSKKHQQEIIQEETVVEEDEPEQEEPEEQEEKSLPEISPPKKTPAVKIQKAKVRPRKRVEKYLKDLEKDHKKVYDTVSKTIKKPEEKIDPEHFFILKNGRPIKNLHELVKALKTIDDDTFKHHVNEHKNDFANWLKDILKKEELADEIRNKKAKNELLKILDDYENKYGTVLKKHKDEMVSWRKTQEELLDRVRKARDELYDFQAQLDAKEKEIAQRAKLISNSKAFDVEGFKKKMRMQFEQKQKLLAKSFEQQKIALQKEKVAFAEKSKGFEKKLKDVEQAKKSLAKELQEIEKRKNSFDSLKKKLESSLLASREKEADIRSKAAEISRREKSLEVKERVVQRREEKLESLYSADKELKKSLADMREKLDHEKSAVESQGFKEYVKEELSQLYPQHINQVTNIDGALDTVNSNHADLHEMVIECRKLLNNNQIADAQKFYNVIKDEFRKRKMGLKEKQDLHNKILELYDDIHLALMS